MKASIPDLLDRMKRETSGAAYEPGAAVEAFSHGTMSLAVVCPKQGNPPSVHRQDAVYAVLSGSADLISDSGSGNERQTLKAGDAAFVRAGDSHRFEAVTGDFHGWLVQWGEVGGEAPAPPPSVYSPADA